MGFSDSINLNTLLNTQVWTHIQYAHTKEWVAVECWSKHMLILTICECITTLSVSIGGPVHKCSQPVIHVALHVDLSDSHRHEQMMKCMYEPLGLWRRNSIIWAYLLNLLNPLSHLKMCSNCFIHRFPKSGILLVQMADNGVPEYLQSSQTGPYSVS